MRRIAALVLMVVGFGGFLVGIGLAPLEAQGGPHADTITIDGNIDPISAGYLARGIDKAHDDGAQLVFVILDTPGGRLDSTRDMVEKILGSEIPVVVYVSPPGSHAASAGTFIVAAAHVAAMAPATNIGAASPVGVSGEDLPETIKSKATQDAAAFIRDIAEERGRNADALEQTVLNAISYSSLEALDNNLVDIIAEDMDDLLAQLDGRRVEIGEGTYVLETDRLEMRRIEPTLVEQFLGFLADPNVAFLLLSLGGLGIWIEFLSPGLMGPGIVGVIALSLALVAMGNLPVNWAGVALIVVAMGLFFLESQARESASSASPVPSASSSEGSCCSVGSVRHPSRVPVSVSACGFLAASVVFFLPTWYSYCVLWCRQERPGTHRAPSGWSGRWVSPLRRWTLVEAYRSPVSCGAQSRTLASPYPKGRKWWSWTSMG